MYKPERRGCPIPLGRPGDTFRRARWPWWRAPGWPGPRDTSSYPSLACTAYPPRLLRLLLPLWRRPQGRFRRRPSGATSFPLPWWKYPPRWRTCPARARLQHLRSCHEGDADAGKRRLRSRGKEGGGGAHPAGPGTGRAGRIASVCENSCLGWEWPIAPRCYNSKYRCCLEGHEGCVLLPTKMEVDRHKQPPLTPLPAAVPAAAAAEAAPGATRPSGKTICLLRS